MPPPLQELQDVWIVQNDAEIQGYADRNEMKNFFKAIKAIYGPYIKRTAPLLSSDGTTLLTEKSQILKRWAEHFRSVLNCSSAISDATIDRVPQVDMKNDLDLPPSLPETIRAMQQISSGKALGSDVIPPEVYKHSRPRLMAELTTLLKEMWRQGQVPQDLKDATIVHLYMEMWRQGQIRARCGGTPRGGSGRASHIRLLPPAVFLTIS
ncbi:unnamed protein product [Schistocephalus solidus]|uniref:Uncharacterized protein n=1 Tax=Schistocephalus solidus TaxID=70667 RepID=A0A183TFI3_SCHSO|nr:unnamed protein product [Schistocephalus solidus]